MSPSEAESALGVRSGCPTNERTYGRTDGEQWSPSRDNSPSVTRARTYGISTRPTARDALRQLIALLDEVTGGHGYPRTDEANATTPQVLAAARRHLDSLRPDPDAARHRAELAGDLCSVGGCLRVSRDCGWCHAHYPDEVAIQRAMQGERTPLLPHERTEVFRRLAAKGFSPAQISSHVGANKQAIIRELAS